MQVLSSADDLELFSTCEQELQNSNSYLEVTSTNFGMIISETKTQMMHFGVNIWVVHLPKMANLIGSTNIEE